MDEKVVWIGFGAGLISASCIYNIALANNAYVESLPKSMFLPTSAVIPLYINLQMVTNILMVVGILITTAFLISRYYEGRKNNDDV